jgi:DNA polymerase/3'-5' exonuclease PolX
MDYAQACYIAQGVVAKLKPVTDRIMVCGSLRRRKKTDIRDLDMVLIPKRQDKKDMFGIVIGKEVDQNFINVVNSWEKVKGDPTGKYTQRLLPDGTKLELALAVPENFGNITMIRTGNSDFSHMMMSIALKRGLKQEGGFLYRESKLIPLYDERQYFEVLGVPYIEPEFRDKDAFRNVKL